MKLKKLMSALIATPNQAADGLLLEALRIGDAPEKKQVLDLIIKRHTPDALTGVLKQYADLPKQCQDIIRTNVRVFYHVLSEAGRSQDKNVRLAAIQIITQARQGKLGYVLSENLRDHDETLSKAACDALVDLARWVNSESRLMHQFGAGDGNDLSMLGEAVDSNDSTVTTAATAGRDLASSYQTLMQQRPEIESAVARALDWARTKHLSDLMRAALLLCDHPQSRILAILKANRHGGQASVMRKLQQPPAADHAEAFLLGASHGHLRTNFAAAFAQIVDTPVLDAILRRTHWLADHQLQLCTQQVTRGTWWDEERIGADLRARSPRDAMRVADWIAASGVNDAVQDRHLVEVLDRVKEDSYARLHVLRAAMSGPSRTSMELLRKMLADADEQIVRVAARELIRRRPPGYENVLLQRMTQGPDSVRRVIGRAIGHIGFEQFWTRFDRMEKDVRRQAGRAMLKLVQDAPQRLGRYLVGGSVPERLQAMQVIQELELTESFRPALSQLCANANAKLRSKAVILLNRSDAVSGDGTIDRVLADNDPRVRANAIELLEAADARGYVPLLSERVRSPHNRERANAIKALHRMRVVDAGEHLREMLRDPRAEHRVSALWTLRQVGLWALLKDVGAIAQQDDNVRVRRYAVAMLKSIIEAAQKNAPARSKVA
ncbi:MAG: HEAT repeat domain-containing protein [Tepidisphaeraceae bacterium]